MPRYDESTLQKKSFPSGFHQMSPNPLETAETADLVTVTEEILNGKLHFLFSGDRPVWKFLERIKKVGLDG